MTNGEFFKDDILKLANEGRGFGVDAKTEEVIWCNNLMCSHCKFYNEYCGCASNKIKWLYEEHIEFPKLTKRQRTWCEALKTGFIARNELGSIYWHQHKPELVVENSRLAYYESDGLFGNLNRFGIDFEFITCECGPWAVEDLLAFPHSENDDEDSEEVK